jgi:uncharacterized protein involved in exopolysaccharide biosynthesis
MDSIQQNTQTIKPSSLITLAKQGWKLLVICVIAGGLAGLVGSYFLSPQYEATSVFSFSIDYARTGLLTDIEEDQAMEVAGDLINSTSVIKSVTERAKELGISVTDEQMKAGLTAERRFDTWLLKVRWNDPEISARLSTLWSEATLSEFQKARQAALKADGLQRYILTLESCFQQSTSGLAAQPLCQPSNRLDLQTEMEKTGADLQQWQDEAKGFFPGFNFTLAQQATIPVAPIQQSRGSLVLAGGLSGLVAAAILSLFFHKI